MVVTCVIGKDGRKYYFRDGRRITHDEGKKSRVKCKEKISKKVTRSRKKSVKRYKKNCIKRSQIPLRSFQEKAVNFLMKKNNDGLLLVHGTGSGKTLTAVAAGECFLDKNPRGKVVLVAPAGLLTNFKKNLEDYGNIINIDAYHLYSFNKFMNLFKAHDPVKCKNTLFIIDEAHNYRNYIKTKTEYSKRFESAMHCAMSADKRLLLTATPFVNKLSDFIPLINFLYGEKIVGRYSEYKAKKTEYYLSNMLSDESIDIFKKLMKGKIDFVEIGKDKNFPQVKQHFVNVPMTKEYQKKYDMLIGGAELDWVFEDPSAFYNAHRRAVNLAAFKYYSLKLNKIIEKIKKGKTLIYTNWIDFGIKPIKEVLNSKHIKYRIFSGQSTAKEKEEAVKLFNEDKIDVMVITRAGGEGLDLKGVRNLVILEPVWHQSGLEQIIGRAVRYKSHTHLPSSKQKVDVWKLVLINHGTKDWRDFDNSTSGDAILYQIIERKQHMNQEINRILKSVSI